MRELPMAGTLPLGALRLRKQKLYNSLTRLQDYRLDFERERIKPLPLLRIAKLQIHVNEEILRVLIRYQGGATSVYHYGKQLRNDIDMWLSENCSDIIECLRRLDREVLEFK